MLGIKIKKSRNENCPECGRSRKRSLLNDALYFSILLLVLYIAFFRPDITQTATCCPCTHLDIVARNLTMNFTG